jgi:hypothetical protein
VGIHADRPPTARVAERDVEPARHAAVGVIEHPDARVLEGQVLQDLARAVGRAPVGEQELELPVEALLAHGGHAVLDVALLVEDRYQN